MSTNSSRDHNGSDALPVPVVPQVLTLSQVAAKLQVNAITVRRLIWKGVLPKVPHIRHVRVPQKALDKFLEGRGSAAV
jgi:excisionase family DNA binding protein